MKLTFSVKTSINTVLDYLTDIEKFVFIHPIIYKMEALGNNQYKVYEKVKIGFFRYAFNYIAKIETYQNEVIIEAKIKGMSSIKMHFYLSENNNQTIIEEVITIKSILPIKKFMHKLFQEQHTILFSNLERKINL